MNTIFKENYILELFIALKMAYYYCFGLRRNLDFPDFLQKKCYNINCRREIKMHYCYDEIIFQLLLLK